MTRTTHNTAAQDQAAAAERDARQIFNQLAGAGDHIRSFGYATPWLAGLFVKVLSGPPRYTRCKHLRGVQSPVPMFLAAHTRRLECGRCSALTAASVAGTREDRTCDRCRRLTPDGSILTLATLIGNVVITAGHCTDCTDAVRGERA